MMWDNISRESKKETLRDCEIHQLALSKLFSFPNHIGTAFTTNPHLMDSASSDIDSFPDPVCLLLRLCISGVGNGQLAAED